MGLTNNLGKLSNMITSTGSNVGINGTPTAFSTNVYFDVIGNTTTQGGLIQSRNSDNSIIGSFFTNANGLNVRTETTNPMLFSTSATERMRITSSGLVGIGTSSPSANLQLSGFTSGLPATSGSAQRGAYRIANSSNIAFDFGTVAAGQAWIQVSDVNNYASNFALLLNPNGGNVGIGTTSPSNTYQGLTIYGSNPSLSLHTSNASGWTWTEYKNSAGTNNFSMGVNQSIPQFVIKAGAGLDSPNFIMSSAGNVGIGNVSPTFKLHVLASDGLMGMFATSSTSGGYVGFRHSTSTIYGYLGTGNFLVTGATVSDFAMTTGGSGNLIFGTGSGNERMRITSGGNLLINTTTNAATGWKLQSNGIVATLGNDAGLVYADRNTTTTQYYFYATGGFTYFFNSGNIAQINMSNGAYTALSDINKKKDFENSTIGLNAILGLKPTLYRMKTDNKETEKQLGFIAQEVKEFIPQAYVESGEGEDKFIGLQDRPIIAALVKAIQEQQQQIDELKSLINK